MLGNGFKLSKCLRISARKQDQLDSDLIMVISNSKASSYPFKVFEGNVARTTTDPVSDYEKGRSAAIYWSRDQIQTKRNIYGDNMWPIIFMLKLAGHTPLTYEASDPGRPTKRQLGLGNAKHLNMGERQHVARRYRICYNNKSFILLWTAFVAIITILDWVTFGFDNLTDTIITSGGFGRQRFTEVMIGKRFGGNSSPWLKAMNAIFVMVPAMQTAELFFSWRESQLLGEFLNNWDTFQKEYEQVFPRCDKVIANGEKELVRARNYFLLFYVGIPTVVSIPLSFMMGTVNFILHILTIPPFLLHMTTVSLLEDLKVIVTYWNIANAFSAIHQGLLQENKRRVMENIHLTVSEVQQWQKIVQYVRQQVNLACIWQKNHQLLWVGGSVILTTCFVFIEFTIPLSTFETQAMAALIVVFPVLTFGRLYLKIIAASRITQQEHRISQEMLSLNTLEENPVIRSELKFLYNMILKDPSVISFGSYVILNKRLILGVIN